MKPARLLIILAIVAVVFGAGLIVFKAKNSQKQNIKTEKSTTFSGIAPTPVVAGTEGGRDYRDLSFNYSFRYPRDWSVVTTLASEEDALGEAVLTSPSGQNITVTVFNNANKLNSKQMADKFVASYSAQNLERSDVNISGFEGEKVMISEGFARIAVTKGTWAYRINLFPYSEGDSSEEIYSKILDTFHFI